mmetsp:Transcript_32693/g.86356  ORF Transcript_32693/g.86356 Transcript_32693/m.86356 type:complete len:238 (+) Transcript_32693:563-1276(+)
MPLHLAHSASSSPSSSAIAFSTTFSSVETVAWKPKSGSTSATSCQSSLTFVLASIKLASSLAYASARPDRKTSVSVMPISECSSEAALSADRGTSLHWVPPHSRERRDPIGVSSAYGTWPPASAFMICTFWLPRKSRSSPALAMASPIVASLGILRAISAPVWICFRRMTIFSAPPAPAPSFAVSRREPWAPKPSPRRRTRSSPAPEPVLRKKGLRPQKTTWRPRSTSTSPERYGCM